jgi:hypothetical protein
MKAFSCESLSSWILQSMTTIVVVSKMTRTAENISSAKNNFSDSIGHLYEDSLLRLPRFLLMPNPTDLLLNLQEHISCISIAMSGPPITNAVCCNFLAHGGIVVHVQLVGAPFSFLPFFRPAVHKGGSVADEPVTRTKPDILLTFLDGTAPLDVSDKVGIYLVLFKTHLQCRQNTSCRNLTLASSENSKSRNFKGTISE